MSDIVNAKGGESKFKPHPTGSFVGQCVDVIDLGEFVKEYPGTESYVAQECAIVFRTGERNEQLGEFIDIAATFTVSMGPKANLRKFLQTWRGQEYTEAQATEGVPLHKLTGNHGLLTVAHRESAKKRTYANILSCVGIPAQMKAMVTKYEDYKRADYWEEKKKANRDAVAKFRGDIERTAGEEPDFSNAPDMTGDESEDFFTVLT